MSHQLQQDTERLETLCREAYGVIAGGIQNCDCFESLVHIKRFIQKNRKQKGPVFEFRKQMMGYHVFPFFIDIIIRNALPKFGAQVFDENTIAWLLDKYIDFPEIIQLPSGELNRDKYVPEWLIRAAFEQLSIQEMIRTLVPRVLFLYSEIPQKSKERHARILQSSEEVFKRQFRVQLDEVLLCTFALGAIASDSDRFKEKLTCEVPWMKSYIESDAMPIIRSQLTMTKEEYIRQAEERFSGTYTFIKSEPQLITSRPILKFDDYYIAPEPFLLITRVTKLLHDAVYQYFIDNDKLQDYMSTFGEVFKDYVGLILCECFGRDNVIDLDTLKGIKGKRADWLVLYKDDAALFECKAIRYPKELRRTGNLEVLDSFVTEKIGPALEQLRETENQFGSIQSEVPRTKGVKSVYKYVVFEEHFHFANHIMDFLPSNKVIIDLNSSKTLILSALDLETVQSCNYSHDFESVFAAKSNGAKPDLPFELHMRELPKFRFKPDNLLDNKFREFFHRS